MSWGRTNNGNMQTAPCLEEGKLESCSERHRRAGVPRRPSAGGRSVEAKDRASCRQGPVDRSSRLEPGRGTGEARVWDQPHPTPVSCCTEEARHTQ